MLIEVRQPYVDVSAQDLTLTLGAPPAPALDVLHVTTGGERIELRLLGFSHQALVGSLSETVACVPGVAGSLPLRRTSGGYDFRARVERHSDEAYATRAAALIAAAADDPHALAGVFADAPGAAARRDARLPAFTALAARPLAGGRGIAWTTWHGYPQSGEIVVTASSLERGA